MVAKTAGQRAGRLGTKSVSSEVELISNQGVTEVM